MNQYTVDQIEELKELTVYGMIEGEQTFIEAFADAVNYMELSTLSYTGKFQRECVEKVNEWMKKNN